MAHTCNFLKIFKNGWRISHWDVLSSCRLWVSFIELNSSVHYVYNSCQLHWYIDEMLESTNEKSWFKKQTNYSVVEAWLECQNVMIHSTETTIRKIHIQTFLNFNKAAMPMYSCPVNAYLQTFWNFKKLFLERYDLCFPNSWTAVRSI